MKSTLRTPAALPAGSALYRRWWHSFWLWLAVALLLATLILWGHSAPAQSDRNSEIVDRALALHPDTKNGAAIYRQYCISCHGKDAIGSADKVAPALAGQWQNYLVKQLVDFAEGDRTAPEMHRLSALKELTAPQVMRDVASYLSGLAPNATPQLGDGKQISTGKRVYRELCAECHGEKGEGDELSVVPALRGQHFAYLLSQMRTLAAGHRDGVDVDVLADLESLSFDELTALADYASRLPARQGSLATLAVNP